MPKRPYFTNLEGLSNSMERQEKETMEQGLGERKAMTPSEAIERQESNYCDHLVQHVQQYSFPSVITA